MPSTKSKTWCPPSRRCPRAAARIARRACWGKVSVEIGSGEFCVACLFPSFIICFVWNLCVSRFQRRNFAASYAQRTETCRSRLISWRRKSVISIWRLCKFSSHALSFVFFSPDVWLCWALQSRVALFFSFRKCQQALPTNGIEMAKPNQPENISRMFDEYVQARILQSWKFWIVSFFDVAGDW